MERKTNIFLAKKLFTELVFNTAYIENVNVTFPQTQAILDGAIVNNVPVSDIQTVLNLRDAWKYCIENLDNSIDLEYICKINSLVSRNESLEWGTLRTGSVGISGTDYLPSIPKKEEVNNELNKINAINNPIEKAIEYFCYGVKSQLFWDGNKRTSTIVACNILISSGEGILTIGKSNALNFNEALLNLYDTGDKEPLKNCLLNCIKTINIPTQIETAEAQEDLEDEFEL